MSYIDYNNEEPAVGKDGWNHPKLQKLWKDLHFVHHNAYVSWGAKEASLLSKLIKDYPAWELAEMFNWWMENYSPPQAGSFGLFYKLASLANREVRKANEEWKWS